ncbi:NAD-dependent protein deacetylase [Parahaliea mediterranea]|uniref:protein acetyllysine N-acetyltransferase n=1 Tax=Parahaliea mediterranea TaxID=651086 RepID=A0A939DI29_9GAMM|nr:NAD-dependent protein deacetylase [Parahaliea mediterranea]MBN7798418.1 NAD-dependent protein deacetylase [Parahaliea mediterranea]
MHTDDAHSARLLDFIARYPRLVVLTGAGVSAGSGIPTYRDREGNWQHSAPITHQAFVGSDSARRRYWTRSLAGWPAVRDARPNGAHLALAAMERAGVVELVITQNVDRLHQRAGSRKVIDLHGRLDRVRCLDCEGLQSREDIQRHFAHGGVHPQPAPAAPRPDGDADITEPAADLQPPRCPACRGMVMPDVVFFGGAVPRDTVACCKAAIDTADALLVVGSSLQVYSGFRFCRYARDTGKPLALLNPGASRADPMAALKLAANCAPVLAAVANHLTTTPAAPPPR